MLLANILIRKHMHSVRTHAHTHSVRTHLQAHTCKHSAHTPASTHAHTRTVCASTHAQCAHTLLLYTFISLHSYLLLFLHPTPQHQQVPHASPPNMRPSTSHCPSHTHPHLLPTTPSHDLQPQLHHDFRKLSSRPASQPCPPPHQFLLHSNRPSRQAPLPLNTDPDPFLPHISPSHQHSHPLPTPPLILKSLFPPPPPHHSPRTHLSRHPSSLYQNHCHRSNLYDASHLAPVLASAPFPEEQHCVPEALAGGQQDCSPFDPVSPFEMPPHVRALLLRKLGAWLPLGDGSVRDVGGAGAGADAYDVSRSIRGGVDEGEHDFQICSTSARSCSKQQRREAQEGLDSQGDQNFKVAGSQLELQGGSAGSQRARDVLLEGGRACGQQGVPPTKEMHVCPEGEVCRGRDCLALQAHGPWPNDHSACSGMQASVRSVRGVRVCVCCAFWGLLFTVVCPPSTTHWAHTSLLCPALMRNAQTERLAVELLSKTQPIAYHPSCTHSSALPCSLKRFSSQTPGCQFTIVYSTHSKPPIVHT